MAPPQKGRDRGRRGEGGGGGGNQGGPESRPPHPSQDGWNSWSRRLSGGEESGTATEECELERKQVLERCPTFPSPFLLTRKPTSAFYVLEQGSRRNTRP